MRIRIANKLRSTLAVSTGLRFPTPWPEATHCLIVEVRLHRELHPFEAHVHVGARRPSRMRIAAAAMACRSSCGHCDA